jgi:hypothetical protein
LDQLNPVDALAAGAVEQDGVAIGFPNGGQLDAPRAMQAKENAARPFAADQDAFRDFKRSRLQFMLVAKAMMDKSTQVIQVVKL